MALKIRKTKLAAALDIMLAAINVNPVAGYVEIRTGAAPTNLEDANSGTLLSTCTLVDPTHAAFASTPTTSPLTAVGYTSGSVFASDGDIVASGTAGHFRLFNSANQAIAQGTCGVGSGDLQLDSVSFVQHGTCTISQFDVTIA